MGKYIDNIIIELKKTYSKDELVATLIKNESKLKQEIGFLTSERDELKYKLDKALKLGIVNKEKLGEQEYYKNIKEEISHLKEKNRKLKIQNEKLIFDLLKVKNS